MQHGQDEACLKQFKRTGHWIKDQTRHLRHYSRGQHFERALKWFYTHILAVCANSESCVNHIHLTAILGGLAKAWATGEACHAVQNHQQTVDDLHRFTAKMLELLQPVCKALGVREASNLLSSLSALSIDPKRMAPGAVDAIAQQLMDNMDHANVQDLSAVVAGYSMLQLTPYCEDLLQAVSKHLAVADLSRTWSYHVSRMAYNLATIPNGAPSLQALEALCERFGFLLRTPQVAERPNAQAVANMMWALSKLKYVPSHELATSMMGRIVFLCSLPGQQPTPPNISSLLLACAQLSVPVKQTDIESLVSMLFSNNQVTAQVYTNTAWSLAVLGCLHNQLLDALIDRLSLPSTGHAENLLPSLLGNAGLEQLYQALTWLQPSSSASAHQHELWCSLQGKLHRLGPRPTHIFKCNLGNNGKLCSALNQLQLSFRARVVIQSYGADAVLESKGDKAQPIILSLGRPDCIRNVPGR